MRTGIVDVGGHIIEKDTKTHAIHPISIARLHDLRHFVATQMIGAGDDIRTVAGRFGHANPSTTFNVYSAFLKEKDRAAAEVLGRLLDDE